jgi:hypothetical protein
MNEADRELWLINLGITGMGVGMAAFRNRPGVLIPLSFGTVMLSGLGILRILGTMESKPEEVKKEKEKVSVTDERVVPSFNLL